MSGTNKSALGVSYLLMAAFAYASMGIFSKIMAGAFAPFTQTWTRGIFTLACFFSLGICKKAFTKIQKADLKWFLIVGILGSLTLAPTFYSFVHLTIGTALFVQYAATIICSYILEILFFGGKVNKTSIITLALSISGLLLVYWSNLHFNSGQLIPLMAAFIGGSFFSTWFVFSKKLSHKYSTLQINTSSYICAIIINFIIALLIQEPFNDNFNSPAWLANIGYAIVSFAGSGLALYGFKFISPHIGSIVLLAEVLFGTLFGVILFQEQINPVTLAGGILIICAILIPNLSKISPKD